MSGSPGSVDEITSGDHICSMHTSIERRDDILVPFLRDGLVAGHKCVAALADPDFGYLQARLGSRSEVGRWLVSRQLELLGATVRVASPETSSVAKLVDFWQSAQSSVGDSGGYECVRVAAELNWWLPQVSGMSQLLQFESMLNRLSERYSAATLCMYDMSSLDGALIIDLVSTHPKLIVEGVRVDNPAYLPPQYFDR